MSWKLAIYLVGVLLATFSVSWAKKVELKWSTYLGGEEADYAGSSATCFDNNGNLYLVGKTNSPGLAEGVTEGEEIGGQEDGLIAKFSPVGTLLWCRYLGGSASDSINAIAFDNVTKTLIVGGETQSDSAFGVGGDDATLGEKGVDKGGDGFLAKMDSGDGKVIWSTYVGGEGEDAILGVSVNELGQAVVVGYSDSEKGVATNGTHQSKLSSVARDGMIALYGKGGVKKWGTYWGGSFGEELFDVEISSNGAVIVAGMTFSDDGIATRGAVVSSFQGGDDFGDGMIGSFDSETGKRNWGTYYGGNRGDFFSALSTRFAGYIFAGGTTLSATEIATPGAYQDDNGTCNNCSNGFVVALTNQGELVWASYVGALQDDDQRDYITDLVATKDGDLYIVGLTESSEFVPANNFAYDPHLNGASDGFLLKLDASDSTYRGSTYFGGVNSDSLKSIALRETISGNRYFALVGQTNSPWLASFGAHQENYGGGTSDIFLARMREWPNFVEIP